MEDMKDYVNEQIEKKFLIIDKKLKNSFQEMKKDNDLIKEKLSVVEAYPEKINENKVELVTVSQKISELSIRLSKAEESNSKDKETLKVRVEEIEKKISQRLESEVKRAKEEMSKNGLENSRKIEEFEGKIKDLSNELRKDIFRELDKEVDEKFLRFSKKADEVKSNLNSIKKSFSGQIALALEKNSELGEKTSDLEDLYKKCIKKIDSEIEEKDKKLEELNNQIVYLKGKIKAKTPEPKKETQKEGAKEKIEEDKLKKKSFISKLIDGLAD